MLYFPGFRGNKSMAVYVDSDWMSKD